MCNLRQHKMAMNFSYFSFCLVSFVLFGRIYYITPHYYSLSEKLVAALIVTLCGAETIADNINKALQYMGGFICSIRIKAVVFSARIFHCFKPKNNKKFQRTNAIAIRLCCLRIHPIVYFPCSESSQHI